MEQILKPEMIATTYSKKGGLYEVMHTDDPKNYSLMSLDSRIIYSIPPNNLRPFWLQVGDHIFLGLYGYHKIIRFMGGGKVVTLSEHQDGIEKAYNLSFIARNFEGRIL